MARRTAITPKRPAPSGSGEIEQEGVELKCGHYADAEPVIVFPVRSRRYWCEACRSLQRKK